MFTTVYVVGFEPNECAWVRSALGRSVQAVVNVEDGAALLAQVSDGTDQ